MEENILKTSKDVFSLAIANKEFLIHHTIRRKGSEWGFIIKNLKRYKNTKTELDMINLELEQMEEKETLLRKTKENLNEYANHLSTIIHKMDKELRELDGIEYSLYYEIVVQGTNVTRAVDKVALKYDKDVSTIWKNYYPKVKEILQEFEQK